MKKDTRFDCCCYLCEYSTKVLDGEHYLCKKKGIVSPEFVCKSFIFDPLKKDISVRIVPQNFDPGDFII
ncbi:MAG: hypothetical protein IJO74_06270 [Clostridia bacterium]|nr:hypothetical protein [Clostridia bacterium]